MPYQTNVYPANPFYFFILIFILFFGGNTYAADLWKHVAPGIEYQPLEVGILNPWSKVHVFRIDLSKNHLESVTAKSLGLSTAEAAQFAKLSHALISMNGGFFDRESNPLGLRINHSKLENPLKPISWWGIFYIKNTKAHIKSLKQYKPNEGIEFALQSGPRLLVKGKIPELKQGKADRSALGITKDGKIILLVTSNAPMSTKYLAHLMKAYPLSCRDAINLDGGSSSQLYAQMKSFKLNVPGFANVSDAIVVKPIEENNALK